ncbi:MAG TPA: LytTR family DNA-binding domain-containing protein [Saprospiraceae bacterium]|nr:LytTR family DNA-binding domain-containing protein [Saprospiraceae bacterium]
MRIVIIEDEDAAVRRLQKLLTQVDSRNEVLATLDSIASAVQWIEENPAPDLLLMDIHLADGSSLEIFKHTKIQSPVIFTTAYDQYAVEAFRVNAIDYLLKPIKLEELTEAIARITRNTSGTSATQMAEQTMDLVQRLGRSGLLPTTQRTLVKIGQTMKIVDLNESAYFYSQDKMTFAISPDGKRYPVDDTLEQLENRLDSARFFRINRQLIVGIDAIEEMYAYSKSRVKIKLHPPFTQGDAIVSTERSPFFKRWLTGDEA